MTRTETATVNAARTPDVVAVLDAVRNTGMSALPTRTESVSYLVELIAIKLGRNPLALQAEVEAYTDALNAHHG